MYVCVCVCVCVCIYLGLICLFLSFYIASSSLNKGCHGTQCGDWSSTASIGGMGREGEEDVADGWSLATITHHNTLWTNHVTAGFVCQPQYDVYWLGGAMPYVGVA